MNRTSRKQAGIKTTSRNEQRTPKSGARRTQDGTKYAELRIRNIAMDTSPEELLALFSRFLVLGLRINLILPQDESEMEAFMTLPKNDGMEAYEWAREQSLRGQKLDVAILREGTWWSLA